MGCTNRQTRSPDYGFCRRPYRETRQDRTPNPSKWVWTGPAKTPVAEGDHDRLDRAAFDRLRKQTKRRNSLAVTWMNYHPHAYAAVSAEMVRAQR